MVSGILGRLGGAGAVVAMLGSGVAGAQAVAVGAVAGTVVDERGQPVPAARVLLPAAERSAGTRGDGGFVMGGVRAGVQRLRVARIGFAPLDTSVVVVAGDTLRLALVVTATPVQVAGVQVTATPTGRDPLAVAQATSTIDGAALERALGSSLGATLAREPGVALRGQGPGASAPIIRGMSGDRVVMLQDGVRVGDLSGSAADHGVTIDPTAASRVEIIRGPAALLYGNNALGGVVNVISDDIPLARPSAPTGSATLALESAAAGGAVGIEGTAPLGARASVRARAGARRHDDLRVGQGAAVARLGNTRLESRQATVGAAVHGERASGGVAWRGYGFEYGLPYDATVAGAPRVTLDGERHELVARAERRQEAGVVEAVRAEATAQWYEHRERGADRAVATSLALRSQMLQVVARTRPLGPFRDGAVGTQLLLRQNGVTGAQALTPANGSSGLGAFVFQELPLGHAAWAGGAPVRLPLGARVDRYAIESESSARFGAARRRTVTAVSASAGLVVPLATGLSLAGHLARAVRPPTAEELFSSAGHAGTGAFEIGNPNLGAESNTGVDVVLRAERRGLSAQAAAYASRVDGYVGLYRALDAAGQPADTVVPAAGGGTARYPLYRASQRLVRARGLEAQAEGVVGGRWVLGAMGDVVRMHDAAGDAVPFLPPARLGAHGRFDDGRLTAGGGMRYGFAQRDVAPGETPTGAWAVADLHLGLRLAAGGRTHAVTLRVENLFDRAWYDAASRIKAFAPNPGRNVAVVYRAGM